jgi:gamma-glutamyl-gamma-aminobutyrate hydrolase PuuD
VQWHAETLVEGPAHARLFEALVTASRPAERRAA